MEFTIAKDEIKEILLKYSKIVVIGCSRHEEKDAHAVPKYLIEKGYEVFCVNPNAEKIFGKKVYRSVDEVPAEAFEIVVVFRPGKEVKEIAKKLLESGKIPKVFWMQEGIKNEEARRMLEEKGVKVIEDRCIRKEFARVFEKKGKEYEQILKFVRAYAKARGFRLNPDPEKLDAIIMGLVENQRKYGYRFCPCRIVTGRWEEDKDKICPCKWHLQEIEEMGHCHCGLFWKS